MKSWIQQIYFNMKRIIITGGSGQLGRTINDLLISNYETLNDKICIDFPDHASFDITKYEELETYIQDKDVVCIINCAAYTDVTKAETDKTAYKVNIIGTGNLVKLCKAHNIFLVHISTDYVFNGSQNVKYENIASECVPTTQYGISKMTAEMHITANMKKYSIIRTSWLYSSYGHNFVKTIIDKLEACSIDMLETDSVEPIKVVYDQVGSPTYAVDLASFIIRNYILPYAYGGHCKTGIFHYSDLGTISWYDFAVAIKDLLEEQLHAQYTRKIVPIVTEDLKSSCRRPQISILSKAKTVEEFKEDIPHWYESLKKFISSYISYNFLSKS